MTNLEQQIEALPRYGFDEEDSSGFEQRDDGYYVPLDDVLKVVRAAASAPKAEGDVLLPDAEEYFRAQLSTSGLKKYDADKPISLTVAVWCEIMSDYAHEAVAAVLAQAAPVAVPSVPTVEMLNAARDWSVKKYGQGIGNDAAIGCWTAMLAAAPAAPVAAAVPAGWVSAAAQDVLAERRRQVEVEGWTADQDDEYTGGQMAVAAGYYALASGYPHERDIGRGVLPSGWPWTRDWWKPRDARRNLVKAGALVLAEIERIDRAAAPAPDGAAS